MQMKIWNNFALKARVKVLIKVWGVKTKSLSISLINSNIW